MKKANKIMAAFVGLGLLVGGCARPTKHESTYRTNLENEYSWQEVGPDFRFYSPFYDQKVVSHKRQVMMYPLDQAPIDDKGNEAKLNKEQRSSLETKQSIVTAEENDIKSIMIQEMIIAYNQIPKEKAVKRFYVEHRPEDQYMLQNNLDGIVRTFLQTKTRTYLEENQTNLGIEMMKYIKNFKVGGTPEFDKNGKVTSFKGGYTLEDEWGIKITEVTPRRIKAPSYVLSAIPEGTSIKKKAQAEFESAQADAERRRSKLKSVKRIISKVGNNSSAADYLNAQTIAEMVEFLGAENIGRLSIVQGLGSTEAKANYGVTRK